ncbi:MAG: hypothetical protein O3B08_00110 [Proteobacteria bacterium]|nr:hypothetical protein [Pseudomonadota bacterium]
MLARTGLLIAVGMLLAACAGEKDSRIACPDVDVLRGLGDVTRFNPGPGRDPTDVLLEAWIDRVGGSCQRDDENLLVDLAVRIVTRRGPANRTESATIPYFVAITDLQRNILSRQTFSAETPYVSRKSISFEDVLTLTIPLSPGVETDSFSIFVGLELSEEELRYNRSKLKN